MRHSGVPCRYPSEPKVMKCDFKRAYVILYIYNMNIVLYYIVRKIERQKSQFRNYVSGILLLIFQVITIGPTSCHQLFTPSRIVLVTVIPNGCDCGSTRHHGAQQRHLELVQTRQLIIYTIIQKGYFHIFARTSVDVERGFIGRSLQNSSARFSSFLTSQQPFQIPLPEMDCDQVRGL